MANNSTTQRDTPMENNDTNDHYKPDLLVWPGWVELESEPAYFNKMLKEMGITDIKIQDIYDLSVDMLVQLPQPMHAFIFLFKYQDPVREDLNASFPEAVWFARQVPKNACATFAIFNVVNNIPDLNLGSLQQFKADTMTMTPLERGNALDQLHCVRALHNSFASENDIIAMDQALQKDIADDIKRKKAAKAKQERAIRALAKAATKASNASLVQSRSSTRVQDRERNKGDVAHQPSAEVSIQSSQNKSTKTSDRPKRSATIRKAVKQDDAAYHFCVYMPAADKLWKMDPLEPTPELIADIPQGASWIEMAASAIQARMLMYQDQSIEFNLMAVVHDPLASAKQDLVSNIKAIIEAEKRLSVLAEDWREIDDIRTAEHIVGPSLPYDVTSYDIEHATLAVKDVQKLEQATGLNELFDVRRELLGTQPRLRSALRDLMAAAIPDEVKARHRRYDYAAFVRAWMEELAEAEAICSLLSNTTS